MRACVRVCVCVCVCKISVILILNVPNNFSVMSGQSSCVDSVLSKGLYVLPKDITQ